MENVKGKKTCMEKMAILRFFHFRVDESKKRRGYTNNIQGKYIQ